jgi:hypothetical protein
LEIVLSLTLHLYSRLLMVTKTKSSSSYIDGRVKIIDTPPGLSGYYGDGQQIERTLTSTVTADYPIWNYHRIIKNGNNATTDLTGFKHGFSSKPYLTSGKSVLKPPSLYPAFGPSTYRSWRYIFLNGQHTFRKVSGILGIHKLMAPTDFVPGLFEDVRSRAKAEFSKHFVKKQRTFQSLVFGGELAQTLRLIRRPAIALRKGVQYYLDYKVKKLYKGKTTLRDKHRIATDSWLEYSYGVRPLVADVDDGMKTLADLRERMHSKVPVSGYAIDMANAVPVSVGYDGFSNVITSYGIREHKCAAYSKIYGGMYCPTFEDFYFSRLGLSFNDVAPAIYELIPYSFLVDYFSNLGAVINAWSYGTANLNWISRISIGAQELSFTDISMREGFDFVTTVYFESMERGPKLYYVRRSVIRERYYDGGIFPDLRFECPGLGSTKWVNIAALTFSHDKYRRAIFGR